MKNKTVLKAIGITCILGAVVAGVTRRFSISPREGPSVQGRLAPSFVLKNVAGRPFSLTEFRGQVVVLHFWASWCPPCIDEIPRWVDFSRGFDGKKIKFIAVSMDERWENALKILSQDHLPQNMISVLDESGTLAEEYGTYQFPETYLISPTQEIVTKWVGPQDWSRPEIRSQVLQLGGD